MSKFTLIKQAANLVVKHKSLIFKAVGIGMVIGGVAVGVKKGADLKEGIVKAQEEKGSEPLTKIETAKLAARYLWVPAALVTGGLTGLCYGYKIDIKELTKECATLTASYQGVKSAADALQQNLNSQIEATKEIVGEEKAKEIKEAVMAKKVESPKIQNQFAQIMNVPHNEGDILYMEPITEQLSWDDPFLPKRVENELNDNRNVDDMGVVPFDAALKVMPGCRTSQASSMWGFPPRNRFQNSHIQVNTYGRIIDDNLPAVKVLDYSEDPELLGPEYANYYFR